MSNGIIVEKYIFLALQPTFDLAVGIKRSLPMPILAAVLAVACENQTNFVSRIDDMVRTERKRVERFFKSRFEQPFETVVCKDRSEFDAYLQRRWQFTSEKWMVAAGVADALVILDPRVWNDQAVDHDGNDTEHVRGIVAHELVHVFHGQHNPTKDFTGADEIGWFVEGLATYVSGQLKLEKSGDARKAIESGTAPKSLTVAWSGKYRYGVCGSMVKYIDASYGRGRLVSLLSATKQEQILSAFGRSESEFLSDWSRWVMQGR